MSASSYGSLFTRIWRGMPRPAILDLKSGVAVELVQKGRVGSRTWRANDDSAARGKPFGVTVEQLGAGVEVAVAISISQSVEAQTKAYIASHLPKVGKIIQFALPTV